MSEHAETAARDALSAVIADTPQDARHIINALSFRDRALLLAWAEELRRLTLEGQGHYESRERSAWRTIRDTAAR
jgi:hypothetical protein